MQVIKHKEKGKKTLLGSIIIDQLATLACNRTFVTQGLWIRPPKSAQATWGDFVACWATSQIQHAAVHIFQLCIKPCDVCSGVQLCIETLVMVVTFMLMHMHAHAGYFV